MRVSCSDGRHVLASICGVPTNLRRCGRRSATSADFGIDWRIRFSPPSHPSMPLARASYRCAPAADIEGRQCYVPCHKPFYFSRPGLIHYISPGKPHPQRKAPGWGDSCVLYVQRLKAADC